MYTKRNYGIPPRTFGGLMEDALQNGWSRITEEVSAFAAPVNIHETDKVYTIQLVAPGLKKEDIKVNVDRNILHISYDHKEDEQAETEGKLLRSEFHHKSFKRSFTLNEKIDANQINARYNDGILILALPKKENAEQPAQAINVE